MGTKNRIFLGIITSQVLHHCRNTFNDKKLVISKKKANKVQKEHPKEANYISEHNFLSFPTCSWECKLK